MLECEFVAQMDCKPVSISDYMEFHINVFRIQNLTCVNRSDVSIKSSFLNSLLYKSLQSADLTKLYQQHMQYTVFTLPSN